MAENADSEILTVSMTQPSPPPDESSNYSSTTHLPLPTDPEASALIVADEIDPAALANGGPPRAFHSPNIPDGKPASYSQVAHPIPQTVSSKDPKAAAQAASDMRNVVRRKLTGYVGFANLPNQWHRKSVRKGFNFNVMVVGMFELETSP
jgi:septin 7